MSQINKTRITQEQAQKYIDEIELGIKDDNSLINKMCTSKRDLIRYLAECYEVLVDTNTITLPKNNIAHFITKKLKSLNVNIARAWVYDSLPSKYKDYRPNQLEESSEWTCDSSDDSFDDVDYAMENKLEINFLTSYINLLKDRRIALKNEAFYSRLEPKEYEEHYIIRNTALNMTENAWNNRKTVPLNTIHLLLLAFDCYNLKYAAGHYISLLKKFGAEKKKDAIRGLAITFSDKQLRKILRGHTKQLHMSMEIRTQDDAYENGFFGKFQCGECESWRIIESSSIINNIKQLVLHCLACGNTDLPPPVKLPFSHPAPIRIIEEKTL